MRRYFLFLFLFFCKATNAQEKIDTIRALQEVVVRAYFSEQPVLRLPSSVSVINEAQLQKQPQSSLVSAINTVPGVRMEERSPGSYRLSIRGSLLRSPFGVRNVKVYIDEFPITDPGGNTYFNLFDAAGVKRIEILKGPEASIFGANSGGVILINPALVSKDSTLLSATINGGSYGLFHEKASVEKAWQNYRLKINQAYQRSDGYRQNSALRRNYADVSQQLKYSKSAEIRALVLYSDLNYRTPGGLTALQMEQNPRSARPATSSLPGAVTQRAGVANNTFFGGVLNELSLNKNFRHVIALFGSNTNFKNPFITNYEVRNENSAGLRTYFELKKATSFGDLNWQVGMEGGKTSSDISNYNNNTGRRGDVQSSDRLKAAYSFFFTHVSVEVDKWYFEAAGSLNFYNYKYGGLIPVSESLSKKKFDEQLMPRIAASYRFTNNFSWRASASRGYSPPTIAEVRASDNVINTNLQAENGWNYETGFRYHSVDDRFYIDAVGFRYHLKDAIVRRLNENDAEYFVNAGGTKQFGLETQAIAWLLKPNNTKVIRGVQLLNSYTYSRFSFSNYQNASTDYSGNRLTGVPRHVIVTGLNLDFPFNLYLFTQHNYTSAIPLDDANTAFSKAYNLLQIKAGWKTGRSKKSSFELYGGVDNLLNVKYSLGNDLNAVGGRYYNPSPLRNFYLGIASNF